MIRPTILTRDNFRSDEDWGRVQQATVSERGLDSNPDSIEIGRRYEFEEIKTIPQNWRRELLNLVLGSHDPALQVEVNKQMPVQVFNLSITPPHVINQTHERMTENYHPDGGAWNRSMMPRTTLVFVHLLSITTSVSSRASCSGAISSKVTESSLGNTTTVLAGS